MTTIYDGSFGTAQPVGNPKVKYPITNYTGLYFVEQDYVQIATAYTSPAFGTTHHVYREAKFCEEMNFAEHGGGLVKFTRRFASTSNADLIESVIEAVTFPGYKLNKVPFQESYRVVENNRSVVKSRTLYAYNIVIREPFSQRVECTRQTRFLNIYEGEGSQEAIQYTKEQLQSRTSISYAGTFAKITFVEDTLVVTIGGSDINISPSDGYYYIPSAKKTSASYYKGQFNIEEPIQVLDTAGSKYTQAIESAYRSQKHPDSLSYRTTETYNVTTTSVPTGYISPTSSPNLDHYQSLIGQYGYLVRPTEVKQFAGSIYQLVTTQTNYK